MPTQPRERIWYEDINGFIDISQIAIFVPDRDMAFEQQLNALCRLATYFAIILAILKQDMRPLFFAIGTFLFTFIIYEVDKSNRKSKQAILEKLDLHQDRKNRFCTLPTTENPFMNVSYTDYKSFPNRPPACDISKSTIRRKVDSYFDKNVCRDAGDIFHKEASDRQFYTNPSTTIPNDQTGFGRWLYQTGPTCKEGNASKCYLTPKSTL